MKKSEFNARVKEMFNDVKEGYYGMPEVLDEIWGYIQDEKDRNKELWKEVQKLRKKVSHAT